MHLHQSQFYDQCEAALELKARFGLEAAAGYLIFEKLAQHIMHATRDWELDEELPSFVCRVQEVFEGDVLLALYSERKPGREKWWPPCGDPSCGICQRAFMAEEAESECRGGDPLAMFVQQVARCRLAHRGYLAQGRPQPSELRRGTDGLVTDWKCVFCGRWILAETDTKPIEAGCPLCWRRRCETCSGTFHGACPTCQGEHERRQVRSAEEPDTEGWHESDNDPGPEPPDETSTRHCVDCGLLVEADDECGIAACSVCGGDVCGYCSSVSGTCSSCSGGSSREGHS